MNWIASTESLPPIGSKIVIRKFNQDKKPWYEYHAGEVKKDEMNLGLILQITNDDCFFDLPHPQIDWILLEGKK